MMTKLPKKHLLTSIIILMLFCVVTQTTWAGGHTITDPPLQTEDGFDYYGRGDGDITGTADQVTVIDNGDDTSTISLPDPLIVGDVYSDGINWVARASAVEGNGWTGITYGNDLFVAVAQSGTSRVMTSPDGTNWTARASATEGNNWLRITYGNGLFVAIASSGTSRVMTSPDGTNWTARTSAIEGNRWRSITYGNGLFVAVADSGTSRVMTSPDGISWTARTSAVEGNSWYGVTYGNGLFVAVANSGTSQVMTSPNGINWTARTSAVEGNGWRSTAYGNGLFIAAASTGTSRVMTSLDGINWTAQTSAVEGNGWWDTAYGNGLFIITSFSGTSRVMTSPDGITWTARTSAVEGNSWYNATYGNGLFVAVSSTGASKAMTSGKPDTYTPPHDNIYHGDTKFTSDITLADSTSAITLLSDLDIGDFDLTLKDLTMDGDFLLQSATDSTTAFQVKQNDGTPFFTLDTSTPCIVAYADFKTDRWLESDTNLFIGRGVVGEGNLTHVAGETGWYNTVLGGDAGKAITTLSTSFLCGHSSGLNLRTGVHNVFLGRSTGIIRTDSDYNTFIGSFSGKDSPNGADYNTCIGYTAGQTIGGDYNIVIGIEAGRNQTGTENVGIGRQSSYFATGNLNTSVGTRSGLWATSAQYNTNIGADANRWNETGDNGVYVGYKAGAGTTQHNKSGNVFLGYNAGLNEGGSNLLYIENSNSATPLIYGEFANDNLGMNVNSFGTNAVGLWAIAKGTMNTADIADQIHIGIEDRGGIAGKAALRLNYEDGSKDVFGDKHGFGTITPIDEVDIVGGIHSVTNQYGTGAWIHNYGDGAPEHTNGTGSYDHTGGSAEQLFTATAGDAFTQTDADNGNWIFLTGANDGAIAEIKVYIDGTHVVVDGMNWIGDLASQTFSVYKHPSSITGDGAKHEFGVGTTGEFEVKGYSFTEPHVAEFTIDAAADDTSLILVEVEGNGYGSVEAIDIFYETGNIQPADRNEVIHVNIDETGATSADATTHIHGIDFAKTNVNSSIASDAMHVGPGFAKAVHVVGTPEEDPGVGWEVASGVVTDRVNSAGAGDDAFVNAAVDQQIFDSDNDYILLGQVGATFEIIQITLATVSSTNANLEFYYSETTVDNGFAAWTEFFPEDGTNGFQNSGSITFSAPAGWDQDDFAEANGDITNAYYIGIKRTRNFIVTPPTEDFFKIFDDQTGGMSVRGDGVVQLPYLTGIPANPANGMMWMENDGLHVYYGGAERTVTDAAP